MLTTSLELIARRGLLPRVARADLQLDAQPTVDTEDQRGFACRGYAPSAQCRRTPGPDGAAQCGRPRLWLRFLPSNTVSLGSVERFWNELESFGAGGCVEAVVPGGEEQVVLGE